MINVSELWHYPFKSGKGISLPFAQFDHEGMCDDRRLVALDKNGLFVTARKHAQLLHLSCTKTENGWLLQHPEKTQTCLIPFTKFSNTFNLLKGKLWHDELNAIDAGNNAASWLSEVIKLDVRVALWQAKARVSSKYELETNFSDAAPLLITSQESLNTVSSLANITPDIRRFRPNIVLSGAEAFAEYNWQQLRIGNLTFELLDTCTRCILTTRDPDTGVAHDNKQPLRALKEHSTNANGQPIFGVNAKLRTSFKGHCNDENKYDKRKEIISIGDEITLI
jgi:uncharacterized protein YcbX